LFFIAFRIISTGFSVQKIIFGVVSCSIWCAVSTRTSQTSMHKIIILIDRTWNWVNLFFRTFTSSSCNIIILFPTIMQSTKHVKQNLRSWRAKIHTIIHHKFFRNLILLQHAMFYRCWLQCLKIFMHVIRNANIVEI